jgi:hypothetical protein
MRTLEEIRQAYIEECAIYNRWLAKTKAKYGIHGDDVLYWGDTDYGNVNKWNDAFKMVERVLGLTKDEIDAIWNQAEIEARKAGKDTPWNYWTEVEVAQ